ncbi:MAG: hypothetical protein COW84_07525 [Gammaproteobacteria bacterium CG22_combo_CG10-13_8_21_14_all_40_8]|nr:MAG: hypothetical protein COW84_07525 [Gammaproteobacteria bacterium CG22_combo_CG10-13_8_21_14_all_40_8]
MDFKLERGHIHIPIEIMGKKGTAILDSGAGINGISPDMLVKFGDQFRRDSKMRIQGVYGTEKKQVYSQIPVKMFGETFTLDKFVEGNFGSADVLLGLSFFRAFVVQIDYPHSKLRMMTRDALDMSHLSNVPMKKNPSTLLPLVKVDINGSGNIWLTFDTGNAGGILLNDKAMSYLGLTPKKNEERKIGVSAGMNSTFALNELFTLNSVKIGPFELENVQGTHALSGQKNNMDNHGGGNRLSSRNGKSSLGLLGFDVLKHFVVTIDYSKTLLNLSLPDE